MKLWSGCWGVSHSPCATHNLSGFASKLLRIIYNNLALCTYSKTKLNPAWTIKVASAPFFLTTQQICSSPSSVHKSDPDLEKSLYFFHLSPFYLHCLLRIANVSLYRCSNNIWTFLKGISYIESAQEEHPICHISPPVHYKVHVRALHSRPPTMLGSLEELIIHRGIPTTPTEPENKQEEMEQQ